jgi:hypothetical protein
MPPVAVHWRLRALSKGRQRPGAVCFDGMDKALRASGLWACHDATSIIGAGHPLRGRADLRARSLSSARSPYDAI